ncbi:uncharacterized protein LOC121873947 [Homarus americanus]|uniref:uncharacterized protein LOC121873947 n=1 Tax=Homarus americanus TaxID=6706 RepID=UPI001C459F27|nr:uncharacterized protein LOC121873947 [Homarus americanus]
MTKLCQCGAKKFTGESLGMCCGNGKVTLDQFPPLPQLFEELFTGESQFSKHFLSRLREYNSLFAMTSFGHKDAAVQGWNPSVRIQGQIYHQLGSLMPPEDRGARYIQVYFLDTLEDQLRARGEHQNLNADILERITAWLNENNHYVRELKTALEQVRQGNINDKKIVIWENKRAQGEHARRFNAPTGAEVAILMSNEPTENRDIVLQLKQGGLRRISELHRSYDPLIEGNYLLLGRRLFQQFLVDAYCKIETERLKFWRREQQSLHAENYSDLRDSLLAADGDPNQVGRRIVLPATYTGGPRYLHEKRSDAMAFVRHYGRADYFITMTCNPRWPEIVDNLAPGQESHDRPDIVARVFRLKVKKFMEHMKKGIFGTLQAWLYTVEYQKRGLPHAHFLFWIAPEHKIKAEEYDLAISAEIPKKEQDKELHDLVMKHMIHGPCGPLNAGSKAFRQSCFFFLYGD